MPGCEASRKVSKGMASILKNAPFPQWDFRHKGRSGLHGAHWQRTLPLHGRTEGEEGLGRGRALLSLSFVLQTSRN